MAGAEELLRARSVVEVAPTLPMVVPGPLRVTVSWTLTLPPRLRMAQLLGPALPKVDWMTSAEPCEARAKTPAAKRGAPNLSAKRGTAPEAFFIILSIEHSRTLTLSRRDSTS